MAASPILSFVHVATAGVTSPAGEDGITYYNKSRAVDEPVVATLSRDRRWVVASFSRTTGNVWSNPKLTCQHVDQETSLGPGQRAIVEVKILVIQGTLNDALQR
jgi:hypothetical protein